MPNADGAGYYRWTVPAADLAKLTGAGWAQLSTRERMSVADALRAAFSRGTAPTAEVLAHVSPLAKDTNPAVATAPMAFLRTARDWLAGDPLAGAVDAHGRKLYAAAYRDLGWGPAKGKTEQPERQMLRQEVIGFLAQTARDPAARKEAVLRGKAYVGHGGDGAIHPEAVDPNLAAVALAVAAEDADAAFFDALVGKLAATSDEVVRGRLLGAIAAVRAPELAARARALTLDPRLKVSEVMTPLGVQLGQPETREAAWKYLVDNLDAIAARLPPGRAGGLPWAGTNFCDAARAQELERIFAPRMPKLQGGPRNLAGALESIRLCAARKDKHLPGVRAFFQQQKAK
jgi:alanyl aminopeptidase